MKSKRNEAKRLMSFVLSMVLVLSCITVPVQTVQAAETSGTCGAEGENGENLTWNLENGELTITGTGAMKNWESSGDVPWSGSRGSITSVVIDSGVTTIGDRAFFGCGSLNSITIPAGVERIGESAFWECGALGSVVFAENSALKSIGEDAFFGCTGLKSIEIPAGVNSIHPEAFKKCASLQIAVVSGNEIYASKDGLLYDKEMKNLLNAAGVSGEFVIPDGVTGIGDYAFSYVGNLTGVTIPSSVESIGKSAFESCSNLRSVTFEGESRLRSMGDWAFYYSNLSSIEIPASVESIGVDAFEDCYRLSSVVIFSANNFGYRAFGPSYSVFVSTVIWPADCNYSLSGIGLSTVATQMQFTDNEDGTVSLSVVRVSDNITNGSESLTLPTGIGDKTISSVSFADGIDTENISVSHSEHYWTDSQKMDSAYHWLTECAVCKEEGEKESHSYGDGDDACACGYVPFTVTDITSPLTLTYGSTQGNGLSVSANTTLGTETVGYQWFVNDIRISDATTDTYALPADMKAGSYIYSCTVSGNGYGRTEEIPVIIAKKQITVQADNKEKTAGEENPALTFSVPDGALVTGDTTADWTVSMNTTAAKDSAAGTYKITGTITSYNYEIIVTPGVLKVKAAQVETPDGGQGGTGDTSGGNQGGTGDTSGGNQGGTGQTPGGSQGGTGETPGGSQGGTGQTPGGSQGGTGQTPGGSQDGTGETPDGSQDGSKGEAPKKGDTITDDKNTAVYKVTAAGDNNGKVGTVQYVKPVKKTGKTVVIPATINADGIKYKVTAIASNAFKNNKYVTKVTIGKYVKTIGSAAFYKCTKLKTVTIGQGVTTINSKAFYGCKKLKTITIKTKKLTSKKVGKNAFKGIKSNATIKVPKTKYKTYKSILQKRGVSKKAVFKKN